MAGSDAGGVLRDLEAEAAESERAVLPAWKAWSTSQAEHIRSELLREGRATGQMQSAVSVRLDERVSELRARLNELADRHGSLFAAWGAALEQLPEEAPRDIWNDRLSQARKEFGELFVEYGYEPNDRKSSQRWGIHAQWEFYNPVTGTARGSHLWSDHVADRALEDAQNRASNAARVLSNERKRLRDEKARDLWS